MKEASAESKTYVNSVQENMNIRICPIHYILF